MYKFKASKYKNAAPSIVKKEECITDASVETPLTFGNFVSASAKLVAFCTGTAGSGKVTVLDVNAKGRIGNGPALNAHSDSITALEFSPFNHCQLATASADNTVKIWDLPEDGITEELALKPAVTLSGFVARPECVAFHPVAENVLAVGSGSTLSIFSADSGERVFDLDLGCDCVQSISWKKDGVAIAVTSKDRRLFVCNPRDGSVLAESEAHENHKESRVVWIGETNSILTTGFSSSRFKEVKLWTFGNGNLSCKEMEEFGTGTGILIPFYDEDTGMILLSAKGDSNVHFLEYFDGKDPPMKIALSQLLPNQTKGMGSLPKLGVNASQGEVNRLYQLTAKMLVPIPWIVPRKSLRDFPADLFPETASDRPALSAQQWIDGQNEKRIKTSLEPSKRLPLRCSSDDAPPEQQKKDSNQTREAAPTKKSPALKPSVKAETPAPTPEAATPVTLKQKYKPFTGVRQSKFRHWKCKVDHPSRHVTNVGPTGVTIYPSSDTLRCSDSYAAVALKGAGGPVGIIDISKPGRMDDSNSLIIRNGKAVVDMQWNPFVASQIAIALESSDIKVWNVPSDRSVESLEDADFTYSGHYSKPVVLCFHPLAENVIASGEVDGKILIWDSSSGETHFDISSVESEIMSLSWSSSGRYIAASSKDKKLRVFDPRKSTDPTQVGPGLPETRSSRLSWACDDKFLALSGFEGTRVVSLHAAQDLSSGPISSLEFTPSPSVLALHYDSDSSTLFCIGKGDTTMHSIEVSQSEAPHLFLLATHSFESPVQGISFLSKKGIDPRKVEFSKAWCFTKTALQGISFTVPRVKMEYFQDDLFPPTAVTWEAAMSASEWLGGSNKTFRKINLRPSDMKPLSEAPPEEVKPKKYESYDSSTYKSDDQKKDELLKAMSGKLDLDKQLEQDTMDGVDDDEWDDY